MAVTRVPVWQRPALVWARRSTLWLLVRRDLKVRYADSVLGYIWTILDPLLMGLTYWLIFGVVFPRRSGDYTPYIIFLMSALLPWQWFTTTVNEAAQSLKRDGALIRSTSLPREMWVTRVVMSKCVEFIYSLPVLIVFVIAYTFFLPHQHLDLNHHLIYFPVAMVLQFILLLGLGLLLAPLVVLLQDLEPLIRVWLRWMLYASPVIYSIQTVYESKLPSWAHDLFLYNPLTGILSLYRAGFFVGSLHRGAVVIAVVETLLLFVIGLNVFVRCEPTVLKEL